MATILESFLRSERWTNPQWPRMSLLRWAAVLSTLFFTAAYLSGHLDSPTFAPHHETKRIKLPKRFEAQVRAKFDSLVRDGTVLYSDTKSELYEDLRFPFEFRIVPILDSKPIQSPTDPNRSRPKGPFIDPDPHEILMNLSSTHRLMANKYAIYRPMLVIPTIKFALQTDDLDLADMQAGWAVLNALDHFLLIYNCGPNSGSSQGHKHLQVIPHPWHNLWPSQAVSITDTAETLPTVPFLHFVLRLPPGAQAEYVQMAYEYLLWWCRARIQASPYKDVVDYNVAITKQWIAIIPRRNAGASGPWGGSTAGMLGIVNVPNQQQRDEWAELGYTRYLTELGVPFWDPNEGKTEEEAQS